MSRANKCVELEVEKKKRANNPRKKKKVTMSSKKKEPPNTRIIKRKLRHDLAASPKGANKLIENKFSETAGKKTHPSRRRRTEHLGRSTTRKIKHQHPPWRVIRHDVHQ